jgi:hypothetical protein
MKEGLVSRNVGVPMTPDEAMAWDDYLAREGLKRGGMVRKLVLAEIEKNQAIRAGRTQIDPACFQRGQE